MTSIFCDVILSIINTVLVRALNEKDRIDNGVSRHDTLAYKKCRDIDYNAWYDQPWQPSRGCNRRSTSCDAGAALY